MVPPLLTKREHTTTERLLGSRLPKIWKLFGAVPEKIVPVKSSNLMKPNPLGCPVYLSFIRAMSASVPYFPK